MDTACSCTEGMNPPHDYPTEILTTLDAHLFHPVRLIVYGRGAIRLGFSHPRPEHHATQDIDGIIPLNEVDQLADNDEFWDAVERTNQTLAAKGLYLTHLFQEDQVFLRPNWHDHLVPILYPETRHLRLFRPHSIDLILTKMMRGNDEEDMRDIEFIVHHDRITGALMEPAFASVRIPDVAEFHDAFRRALPIVRKILESAEGPARNR